MDSLEFMTELENGKYNSICIYIYIYIYIYICSDI